MDITTGSLDDYLERSIAGFKQGQKFYETARSYLETKERLSVKEASLLIFFKKGYKYDSSIYTYGKLIKLMVEATDVDDWYNKIFKESDDDGMNYNRLMDLEKRLHEAKEKGDVVDLIVARHTGGLDPWSASVSYVTTYSRIKVEDWYFKGTALHILPEGAYRFKTERYTDEGLKDIIYCCDPVRESQYVKGYRCNHRGEIVVDKPQYHRVEISSCANEGGE